MAEFVKHDQQAESDDESGNGEKECHASAGLRSGRLSDMEK